MVNSQRLNDSILKHKHTKFKVKCEVMKNRVKFFLKNERQILFLLLETHHLVVSRSAQ